MTANDRILIAVAMCMSPSHGSWHDVVNNEFGNWMLKLDSLKLGGVEVPFLSEHEQCSSRVPQPS